MPTVNFPEAVEFLATGVANPFALDWVPAPAFRGTKNLYESPISNTTQWWNFTIDVIGELYFPENFPPVPIRPRVPLEDVDELVNLTRNSPRQSTFLKVELEYPQGNGKVRRVRFDVGGGIDIFVPPTWRVAATLLVPDPDSIPAELPISFLTGVDFSTLVVATARCVFAPVGRSIGTYTQCHFINPAQASFIEPRRAAAVGTEIFSNEALEVDELAYCYERAPLPDVQALGDLDFGTAAAPSSIPESSWPGSSNCLSYFPTVPPVGGQTVCVVQKLEI